MIRFEEKVYENLWVMW